MRAIRARLLMARHQTVRVSTRYHGSAYGGWTVCPDGLGPTSVVYSFGVGDDASFDLDLIATYGTNVYAFDPTPASIAWVARQSWPTQFTFHPIGIGGEDGVARFFPPKESDYISHSILPQRSGANQAIEVPLQRLATIAGQLNHRRIDILKMDIEGAEYAVIDDITQSPLVDIRQILVEFHPRFAGVAPDATSKAIRKLEMAGYRLFHISGRGVEYSFLRA